MADSHVELLLLCAMCIGLVGAVLSGIPAMVAIAGAPAIIAIIGSLTGVFDLAFFAALPQRIYGVMGNGLLAAIPLFVAMGLIVERSGMAADLIALVSRRASGHAARPIRLALGVLAVSVLLGASTGVVGATIVMLAVTAYPGLVRAGFPASPASGLVLASGTLGQIIPPSIVLIVLADQVSNAWQTAQRNVGNFAVQPVTVGDLFAAALIPGLMLALFYAAYIFLAPGRADTAIDGEVLKSARLIEDQTTSNPPPWWIAFMPLVLIVAVLGSILFGFATPSEAAAIGVGAALLIAAMRMEGSAGKMLGWIGLAALIVLMGEGFLSWLPASMVEPLRMASAGLVLGCLLAAATLAIKDNRLYGVMTETTVITGMIFGIVIAASFFSVVFRGLGGDIVLQGIADGLPGGALAALVIVMALVFILGFFLEFIEITLLIVPICAPVLFALGVDPLWFAVLFAINLQTSFLTPPFGVSLFYFRSAIGDGLATATLYRAVLPFVLLQLLALAAVLMLPDLALFLPRWLSG